VAWCHLVKLLYPSGAWRAEGGLAPARFLLSRIRFFIAIDGSPGIFHLLWVEGQSYWPLPSRAPNVIGLTTRAHKL